MTSRMEQQVAAVRRFNRLITRHLGVLREGLLHSPYSLTESRILFEINNNVDLIASDLSKSLGLDAGYLSRVLDRLEQQNLIHKIRATHDARQRIIQLTEAGKQAAKLLDERSQEEITDFLNDLTASEQVRLLGAMQTIEELLGQGLKYAQPYFIRQHEPGDMGWITHLHGRLYFEEYGWNEEFEALVAQIAADFINHYDPTLERCLIAEMNGDIVGSAMVVKDTDTSAKFRLLLVHPKARGLGLGTRLVDECIRFAKRAGYQKLSLWTNHVLTAARRIYQQAGFTLVDQAPHTSFGHELIGETWELDL